MAIEVAKQIQVFDGIEIENRLRSPVSYRVEQRGRRLVIIIEPLNPTLAQVHPGMIGLRTIGEKPNG